MNDYRNEIYVGMILMAALMMVENVMLSSIDVLDLMGSVTNEMLWMAMLEEDEEAEEET